MFCKGYTCGTNLYRPLYNSKRVTFIKKYLFCNEFSLNAATFRPIRPYGYKEGRGRVGYVIFFLVERVGWLFIVFFPLGPCPYLLKDGSMAEP